MINNLEAIIFDMDGVLVDSEPIHLKAYQQLLVRYGIEYAEADNRPYLGKKDLVIAKDLIARFSLPGSPQEFVSNKEKILIELMKETAIPRPGVKKILQEANELGIIMAVASSATFPTIELVVHTLGIRNYFRSLTSGDHVTNGKPAPDIFLLCAKNLGIEPAHCLVIEDTNAGIQAAKAAGMTCVAIPCPATAHQDHSQADRILSSLEELDLRSLTSASCRKITVP